MGEEGNVRGVGELDGVGAGNARGEPAARLDRRQRIPRAVDHQSAWHSGNIGPEVSLPQPIERAGKGRRGRLPALE